MASCRLYRFWTRYVRCESFLRRVTQYLVGSEPAVPLTPDCNGGAR